MAGIEGKVAEIIDEYTVVINRGYEHGVEEGMRFVIYEPCVEIKDPDTNESLGTFESVKAKVEVTNVSEKISTAETYETYTMPGLGINIPAILREQRRRRELPLDEKAIERLPKCPRTPVKIGDLVRQILD